MRNRRSHIYVPRWRSRSEVYAQRLLRSRHLRAWRLRERCTHPPVHVSNGAATYSPPA